MDANQYIDEIIQDVLTKYPWQKEFNQAALEVLESMRLVIERYPKYAEHRILERLIVPDRVVVFRVPWQDDHGGYQVNRGFRVQFSNALGPYKGGLRLHPTVNLSVLKFLGFEQIFKNSLTGLALGGAKGGSDFDPKGKSDDEVMRFCQAFMNELFHYIGPDTDVPAGDIGVGVREIGYLLGQYKMLTRIYAGGVLTGKSIHWGGSLIRTEATGYGLVYFVDEMLRIRDDEIREKQVLVSGSGNVAQYAIDKVNHFGGIPISCSDSSGTVIDLDGIRGEKFDFLLDLKNVRRGRIAEYAERFRTATFYPGKRPWGLAPAKIALPCATQNELDLDDATALVENGCMCVAEGANMPTTPEAVAYLQGHGVLFGPGKASNAGGVATSGLEMSQNSLRLSWTREEVDEKLRGIMRSIHKRCRDAAEEFGTPDNYVNGANIAGFLRVAKAMDDQGLV
ncbi:NADP-specific glutamate dehydrogenase [Aminiphilus circumscriptus]|jgi:glutamate dehydrogenase (NADP+)|uniref:NADP-specific glutamate dehydrogenase n=1 Tax=Aminiphilus circumscriptus TaxID=290732 RepID=UPI000478652D|nr:NADP-specific glutamate dehydrogenase [Aminiphilus circumscriptus]